MDLLDDDDLLDLRSRRAKSPEAFVRETRRRMAQEDTPERNAALESFVAGGDLRVSDDTGGDIGGTLCPICKARPGRMDCSCCGRKVCHADSWVMFSLCRTCAKEERVQNWSKGPQVDEGNWLEES